MAAERERRGVAVAPWADGRQHLRPLPLDPVPRRPAAEWARLAAGVEQRHRALNAFLAEAYRAAGRRRGDADRAPQVVRAGVLPEWAVAHSPGRDPDAVAQAWPGQPRAARRRHRPAAHRPTGRGWWRRTTCRCRRGSVMPSPTGKLRGAVPGAVRRRAAGRSRGRRAAAAGRSWRPPRRRRARGRRGSPSSRRARRHRVVRARPARRRPRRPAGPRRRSLAAGRRRGRGRRSGASGTRSTCCTAASTTAC